jgi:hypothetical protein
MALINKNPYYQSWIPRLLHTLDGQWMMVVDDGVVVVVEWWQK